MMMWSGRSARPSNVSIVGINSSATVQQMQPLLSSIMGFPMEELRVLLRIAGHRDAPCEDIDALVRGRLTEVEDRIRRLTALRTELTGMLQSHQHGTVADCRVVEVLSDHDHCGHEH